MTSDLHIVILAAGEGTRMQSTLPKVLQPVGGKPMIVHLLETSRRLDPAAIHVVIGSGAQQVRARCAGFDVVWVEQPDRRGTGDAVALAMPAIPDAARVLVLLGDHPLIPADVLRGLVQESQAPLALLTMQLDEPAGYGRIERDPAGRVIGIVEDRDATPAQRAIGEVNTGIASAHARELRRWLQQLGCDNAKGEYYLTDIFGMAHGEGRGIHAVVAPDPRDLMGANDMGQLAGLERRYRQRQAEALLAQGVALADPERTDVRGEVTAGRDVRIDVNVVLEGVVELGDGVVLGPGCVLRDCALAAGTVVNAYSVLEGVRTTGACTVGPFARLRPGTDLAEGCRVGNFVEVKNATLGAGSKVNHLSYIGDADVGARANVGAGTITCNYDGAHKHRTVIGADAFIGSNTELVAPVTVGRGATIGAGSTITRDAPAGELTVGRARQTTVKGWKRPAKPKREGQ